MSIFSVFKGAGPSGFGYRSTAEQVTEGLDLTGKRYLITGCNSGLGLETLRVLGMRGGHVIAAARTLDKAAEAIRTTGADGTPVACELSDRTSVRACVAAVREMGEPLDAIICNAGIMALPEVEQAHGIELQFFTNHIGHFILVTGLLDLLADDGRVVVVSSSAHTMSYDEGIRFDHLDGSAGYKPWKAYGQSKLANVLFVRALAKRFEGTRKTANALHPGVIATNLSRHMNPIVSGIFGSVGRIFLKSVGQGAATETWAATHPDLAETSGEYLADCNVAKCSAHGRDDAMAERLWQVSEEIVAGLS